MRIWWAPSDRDKTFVRHVPHESGSWIEFRQLNWAQLHKARQIRLREAEATIRRTAGEELDRLDELLPDLGNFWRRSDSDNALIFYSVRFRVIALEASVHSVIARPHTDCLTDTFKHPNSQSDAQST